jgi:hypothetical protein
VKDEGERCWDTADRNIVSYRRAIDRAALIGEDRPQCRAMIDKWLEYRVAHGPEDRSKL